MTLGASLLLIAVGAILKFAVTATLAGVSIGTVGVILMVVGIVGLIITLGLQVAGGRSGGPTRATVT